MALAIQERLLALRVRYPRVDHVARTYTHYNDARGNQLAGGVTYFGALSFFPLLAVSFAVLGYVVAVYPDARADVEQFLRENLPGLVGDGDQQINLEQVTDARTGVGILGVLGLIYTGLGWLDALREALRQIYDLPISPGSLAARKVADLGMLVVLGLGVLLTLAVSGVATAVTTQVLALVNLEESTLAIVLLKVLAIGLALAADTFLLTIIFARLPGHRLPWRDVMSAAVLGAMLLELLKILGTYLVSKTTDNPVYGTFAVIVGLLVWMNFVCRALLFSASWGVTGARPLTTPAATEDPLIEIPVREPHHLTARLIRRPHRFTSLAGVLGLLLVRRRNSRQ